MKSKTNAFIRSCWAPIAWSGFILLLCGLPGSDFPDMSKWRLFSFDKIIHFMIFTLLVVLSLKSLKKQNVYKYMKYNSIKVSLGWAVFLGISSEVLQGMIFIERSADVFDAIANTIGSFSGLFVFYLIYGRQNTFRFG